MISSESEIKEQGAVPAPPKGAYIYRLSDGRRITYTATIRVEDLSNRKGGGCDLIHRHKDNTFWLTPAEGSDVFGIVIRETGKVKEAFVGIAEPPKKEKKDVTNTSPARTAEGDNASGETPSPSPQS
jgi:hypothetical protein